MENNWKFIGACADGERFEVDGVNVWDCKWLRKPDEVASVRDPHYNQAHEFAVYDLVLGQRTLRVAAGEFSNGIWGFYAPEHRMNEPIAPQSPAPAPAPAPATVPNPLGSFWLGFWLAWGALFGGYTLVASFLASIANMVRGGGIPDEVWIFLGFSPWLLILALIVIFAAKGKPQTAKGVAVGLASIFGIGLLLFAACFGILMNTSFH